MNIANMNVDSAEIKKFSDQAHAWWDLNGPFKPLHDINSLRLSFIEKHAPLKGKSILDIGCGGGLLTEAMAKQGACVSAIDMDPKAIEVAKNHAADAHLTIDYHHTDAESFAQNQSHRFDMVTCLELLEHVPNPGELVKTASTLVKPGGQLFFSTINRNMKAFLFAIVGAEYVLRLLPRGTHDYKKFIRPSELCQWAREAGCEPVNTAGMEYNPLTRRFSLTGDTSVNYLLHIQKQ